MLASPQTRELVERHQQSIKRSHVGRNISFDYWREQVGCILAARLSLHVSCRPQGVVVVAHHTLVAADLAHGLALSPIGEPPPQGY